MPNHLSLKTFKMVGRALRNIASYIQIFLSNCKRIYDFLSSLNIHRMIAL